MPPRASSTRDGESDESRETLQARVLCEKRTLPLPVTVERARRLMPDLGISRVADITGLDNLGIPVVTVVRPNARSLSVAQGKGLSLEAAEASGLMESIEQHCAERIDLPLKLTTLNELRQTHEVVDIQQLPRTRVSTFHADRRLLWIESLDLVSGARPWIPYEMVHLDMTLPLPPGSGCFPFGSNGLASGNHPFEAFIHGICEVIERDAATLWHHLPADQRERHRLDLDSLSCTTCRDLLHRFDEAEIDVTVWEITSDLGVPAFFAKIIGGGSQVWRPSQAAGGSGCHPARSVALVRALTEAAQSRLATISGSRDDLTPEVFAPSRRAHLPSSAESYRDFADAPDFLGTTLDDDLNHLLDQLTGAGFEQVLAVDLSPPHLGFAVTRIVIPGLETYLNTAGFLPGRRLQAQLRDKAAWRES